MIGPAPLPGLGQTHPDATPTHPVTAAERTLARCLAEHPALTQRQARDPRARTCPGQVPDHPTVSHYCERTCGDTDEHNATGGADEHDEVGPTERPVARCAGSADR